MRVVWTCYVDLDGRIRDDTVYKASITMNEDTIVSAEYSKVRCGEVVDQSDNIGPENMRTKK